VIQRREAKKKPVVSWGMAEVGLQGGLQNTLVLKGLFAPEMGKRQCQFIEGATPAEAGRKLAQRLRSDGVI